MMEKEFSAYDGIIVTSKYENTVYEKYEKQGGSLIQLLAIANIENYKNVKKLPHTGFNVLFSTCTESGKLRKDAMEICSEIVNKYPDVYINVIGIASDKSPLRDVFVKKGLDRIIYRGYVNDVAKLAPTIDLVLHILPDESYAASELFLQEMMVCGVPVLKIGGKGQLDCVTIDSVTGFNVNNVDELYDKFDKLYNDKELLSKMSDGSIKHAIDTFKIDNFAKDYRSFVKKIIKEYSCGK
jgi:glycosyltransferase involved in cell wall biosynthesis